MKKKKKINKKLPRVMIGIPTTGTVTAMTMLSIARCMRNYAGAIEIYHARSAVLVSNRHEIIANAWDWKADYILWIDSDQGFAEDALEILLSRNVPVVGANITKKTIPPVPGAYLETDDYIGPLYTEEDDTGIQQVKHISLGFLLTHISVFNTLAKDPPVFCFKPSEDGLRVTGEDIYFCNQCLKHDIPVYVDHDVSKTTVHVGTFGFTTRHALAGRNIKDRMAQRDFNMKFDKEDVERLDKKETENAA